MSDLSQHGLISTLQRLNRHPRLLIELAALAKAQPVALILPCHGGDLGKPAVARIARELSLAPFIAQVLIPVNGVERHERTAIRAFFKERLALPHRFLWCDTPEEEHPHEAFTPGKGSNVWAAMGLLHREGEAHHLLMADADVKTFQLEMLARMAYAMLDPRLAYTAAKAYYPRVTDRIYGRVSRLFLAPLLEALVRAGGHQPLLDYLRSFRYPLAGECGMSLELAARLPVEAGWGLEVGMLCHWFREIDPRQVCQVDVGVRYDHKHQPLGDGRRGLVRMSREIAQTLLRYLGEEGVCLNEAFRAALPPCFEREAAEALRRSRALAAINGLRFNAEEEATAVSAFSETLAHALDEAVPPARLLPPWTRAGEREQAWLKAVAE